MSAAERHPRSRVPPSVRRPMAAPAQAVTRGCWPTGMDWYRAVWAVLLSAALAGCASAPSADAAPPEPSPSAFTLDIDAPPALAALLQQHLDAQRLRAVPDLTRSELLRIETTLPTQARDLLATQGYFSPLIQVALSPPEIQPPRLHLQVQPGPRTTIEAVDLRLDGPDPERTERLVTEVRRQWRLPEGAYFTQAAWDEAKREALRTLQQRDFARARLVASRADIDPERARATLHLHWDSGPAIRLGPAQVEGAQRYPDEQALRWAERAGLRAGLPYDETLLLAAQRQLTQSGLYDSAFVLLADDGPPDALPVRVQVREAPRQRLQIGLGLSTDSGVRLSAEYTHLRLPGLDWRLDTRLRWTQKDTIVGLEGISPLDGQGWRQRLGWQAEAQRDEPRTRTQQWRWTREQPGLRLDRALFVQWDTSTERRAGAAPERASGLGAGWTWTRRAFDDLDDPRHGYGLVAELGAGWTRTPEQRPYARARARALLLWSPADDSRGQRLALTLEGGAVWAAAGARVPASLRFWAGGDGSVRGYAPRSIGAPGDGGAPQAARLLALASLEWQRPWRHDGALTPWELALFVDGATAGDRWSARESALGVGAGLRYRSPVGPLRADLAYAVRDRRWRLHLGVGFVF